MAKKRIKTTGASSGGKKTGNKRILWIAGAVALGVAGYFGYKWWKKKKEEKDKKDTDSGTFQQDATLPSSTGGGGGGSSTGGGGGGSSYGSLPTNPFSTSAELKAFQEWVINTKKDSTILGTAGADGKWGRKSADAWEKYGADYKKGSTSGGGETGYINWDQQAEGYPNGITNRVVYWLQQAKSSKGKYAWGDKTSPAYMKASKYPSFFVEWAKAVKARAGKPGFYTTFKWNGAVYDSYQGIQRMKTSPQGKLIIAGDMTYAYDSAGKEKYKVTKGNRAGTVSYYDFSDDQIWLKSNEKMPGGLQWYKAKYVTLV